MNYFLIILPLLVVSSGAQDLQSTLEPVNAYTKPAICGQKDCPRYRVLEEFDGYELREYEPTVWAHINAPSMVRLFWEDRTHQREMYNRLDAYFDGNNTEGLKIARTAPVMSIHEEHEVWLGFMLPRELNETAPEPLDDGIQIHMAPVHSLYVRSFKGFGYGNNGLAQYGMSALKQENHFAEELKHLIGLLHRDNRDVSGSRFYTAEFQRQWVFAERHNEVAIPRV